MTVQQTQLLLIQLLDQPVIPTVELCKRRMTSITSSSDLQKVNQLKTVLRVLCWVDTIEETHFFLVSSFVKGIESFIRLPRDNLIFENLKTVDQSMQLMSLNIL